jgi:hypothetical protein
VDIVDVCEWLVLIKEYNIYIVAIWYDSDGNVLFVCSDDNDNELKNNNL